MEAVVQLTAKQVIQSLDQILYYEEHTTSTDFWELSQDQREIAEKFFDSLSDTKVQTLEVTAKLKWFEDNGIPHCEYELVLWVGVISNEDGSQSLVQGGPYDELLIANWSDGVLLALTLLGEANQDIQDGQDHGYKTIKFSVWNEVISTLGMEVRL